MNGAQIWMDSLLSLASLRSGTPMDGGGTMMIKGGLVICGLGGLVWGGVLLRAARIQAGDEQGWYSFREWGVPVSLILAALFLICINDGGRVDRYLSHLHWHLLGRLGVLPPLIASGGSFHRHTQSRPVRVGGQE